MKRLLLFIILMTGCSTFTQMDQTLQHASAVIEENTKRMEEIGEIIEANTEKIKESGLIIAKNTLATRIYTHVMEYFFPIFCIVLFLFNFYFFHRILKRLKQLTPH